MLAPLAGGDLADELALLDAEPAPRRPRPIPAWGAELRAVPDLPPQPCLAGILADIPEQPSELLLRRIGMEHTTAAVLWALHVELDARGIPPCVRSEQQIGTEQARFITTLADLLWIAKRYPGHDPLKKRMRRITHGEPNVDTWHRAALWAYQESLGKPYMLAKWLALTDAQRAHTLTMPAKAQSNERRALPDQLASIREKLLTHARAHPDKSGTVTPDELADRRTRYVRLFVLLGRDYQALHAFLAEVEGRVASVRTLRFQMDAVATINGANKPPLTPRRRFSPP